MTKEGGPDYVPPAERIATFDNDGTLWCEQPLQAQFFFAHERLQALAEKDPSMKERQPFKAFLEHDMKTIHDLGKKGLFEVGAFVHAGVTEDEFDRIARTWLATAKHPKLDRLFTRCTYRPQVELLEYLRANGFRTFIVSGVVSLVLAAFCLLLPHTPPSKEEGSAFAPLEALKLLAVPSILVLFLVTLALNVLALHIVRKYREQYE